ncbi:5791_t:CDS:1, partial [Dentiscutata heterogama]
MVKVNQNTIPLINELQQVNKEKNKNEVQLKEAKEYQNRYEKLETKFHDRYE